MDEFAFMTVLVRADAATTPEEFHWRAAAALREPRDSLVLSCTTTAQLVDSSKSLLSQGDSFFATLKGLAGEPARPASAGAGTSVIRKALEATCVGRRVVEIAHEPLERPSGDEIQRRLAAMRGPLPVGGFDPNGPLVGAPAEGEGDAGLGARLEALAGWAPPPPPRPTGPTRPFLRLSEPPGLPGFMFHSDDGFLVAVEHPGGKRVASTPQRQHGWFVGPRY